MQASGLPNNMLMPKGFARVCSTLIVCSKQFSSTKKVSDLFLASLFAKVIASAAAVASSSNEAFAISIPVNSVMVV